MTTFVIGAGASAEAGLPVGSELKLLIARALTFRFERHQAPVGDQVIYEAIRSHVQLASGRDGDTRPYFQQASNIAKGLPLAISIDHFIDQRESEELAFCAKLAIVREILKAEGSSLLSVDAGNIYNTVNFDRLGETWYTPFWQKLTEGCTKDDLEARFKNITLVIFNYDRCLEHFLFHALINQYSLEPAEASDLVLALNIYHPYGMVGRLPWTQKESTIAFGGEPQPRELLVLTSQIQTFTEGTRPESSDIDKIRESMAEAHTLVFLGFAFDPMNMKLLVPGGQTAVDRACYATTLHISERDSAIVRAAITGYKIRTDLDDPIPDPGVVMTSDATCRAFFDEFWMHLTFA